MSSSPRIYGAILLLGVLALMITAIEGQPLGDHTVRSDCRVPHCKVCLADYVCAKCQEPYEGYFVAECVMTEGSLGTSIEGSEGIRENPTDDQSDNRGN